CYMVFGMPAGDLENDIYELFCKAQKAKTHFLVRTCVDRLAGDGSNNIATEISRVKVKGLYRVEVRDNTGDVLSHCLLVNSQPQLLCNGLG
ncbi:MAG: hypothetical protein ACD_21C00279G0003, partial [uncultured bacterium]